MIMQEPSRALLVTVPGLMLGLAITVLACASKQTAKDSSRSPDSTVQTAEPTPPSMTDPASPMQPEPGDPDPMFACAQDSDCTVLEMGCCDHCNGGWQLAVNTGHTTHASSTSSEGSAIRNHAPPSTRLPQVIRPPSSDMMP